MRRSFSKTSGWRKAGRPATVRQAKRLPSALFPGLLVFATLYILDRYASSQEWGLSDDGRDMFCPGEVQKPEDAGTLYRVSAVLRRKVARSRLNHWEVLGNADRRSV